MPAQRSGLGMLHWSRRSDELGTTVNNKAWVINAPTAVSEIIDGELVVINLDKGSYYCSLGIGAYIWQCLQQQVERTAIEAALVQGLRVNPVQARDDLQSFFDTLSREGLIRPARPGDTVTDVAPPVSGTTYAPPELKVHSDMQDLLLLDPIHDVADEGWPSRQQ